MGNCVPPRSEMTELVVSPSEINRSSLSSILTHDTWTAGEVDDSTENWGMNGADIDQSGTRSVSVSLPSSSPLFILETGLSVISKPIPTMPEQLSNRFIPQEIDNLQTDLNFDLAVQSPQSKKTDLTTVSPSQSGLTNLDYGLCKRRQMPPRLRKNQAYQLEGSPEDSGIGSSFLTSPRVFSRISGSRNSGPGEQGQIISLPGFGRMEQYHTPDASFVALLDHQRKSAAERNSPINNGPLPPIPPKGNYQDTFERNRKRTISPSLESSGLMKLGMENGVYQKPSIATKEPVVVFAIQAFLKQHDDELSMVENERFLVLDFNPPDSQSYAGPENKRWLVTRIDPRFHCLVGMRNVQGLVPARLLELFKIAPDQHPAWCFVDREEADRMLLSMGNPCGTYLLRPSSDTSNAFALSVRCFDVQSQMWLVKHYRVRYKPGEDHYFVFRRAAFNTVEQLINHHSVYADGLVCTLSKPYPQSNSPITRSLEQLEVNRSSLIFVKLLGRGSFGEVWHATWNGRLPVAVKRLLVNESMEAERLLNEAKLMQRLNHPRIVRLLAVCTTPSNQPPYLVTELMENGSLKSYLRLLKFDQVKFAQLIQMMIWVSEGMMYLERQNFIHRDLRASNVLVDQKYQLKVADFGLSHMLGEADEYIGTTLTKFPIRWTAPEGMLKQAYSVKSDIWSFGVLMFEILTFCETPYAGLSSKEVRDHVCSGHRLPRPTMKVRLGNSTLDTLDILNAETDSTVSRCPLDLYTQMLQCWHIEPECRPTFHEVNAYLINYVLKFRGT